MVRSKIKNSVLPIFQKTSIEAETVVNTGVATSGGGN